MDWSDEKEMNKNADAWCFGDQTTIDCDEHQCDNRAWSCGDGQCISWDARLTFLNFRGQHVGCYNLRDVNHMCEFHAFVNGWTLPNGLCWFFKKSYDDPRLHMNNVDLSEMEKCIYLIRCALSDGGEVDCPCNRVDCPSLIAKMCRSHQYYRYPNGSLIRPYIHTYFDLTNDFKNKIPYIILVTANIRCRGYQGYFPFSPDSLIDLPLEYLRVAQLDSYACLFREMIRENSSSIKYDKNCWENSLTFNGLPYAVVPDVCTKSKQCISQYRIHDGWPDCWNGDDEKAPYTNSCSRVRQHRFQCSAEQPTCFLARFLDGFFILCLNKHDQFLYGHGRALEDIQCQKSNLYDCQIFKEYIRDSSLNSNSTTNFYLNTEESSQKSPNRIPYRSYCDTFWNRPKHIDELPENCRHWICHRDEYRCQTGQCIPLDWVCDGQWDCSDASDEEAMPDINQWSQHNQQIKDLEEKRKNCTRRYSQLPFGQFCDLKKEFPCLRSNVSNPFYFNESRPCIPYSKIGDEIQDCYNAYDEKNTFHSKAGAMWGFSLQCGNSSSAYIDACTSHFQTCAQIFCPSRYYQRFDCPNSDDAICINDSRCVPNGRCDRKFDCSYGEDEYWCTYNGHIDQLKYRYTKENSKSNQTISQQQTYPILSHTIISNLIQMKSNLVNPSFNFSFVCNKGVTVIGLNNLICFCPPSYFGDKCQFFSDRITIITHLNLSTFTSQMMPTLFKIKVNFLFNKIIIDHYEFYSNPFDEIHNYMKHKFYLLYSRSTEMLSNKQTRFYNRTDILINHPYSIHFDLYALDDNSSTPKPLGSWHYPIYFDFLSSFRLAKILRFPNWFGNASLDPCLNHTCNQNSTCQPIFNENNSYFCSCKSGFYGKDCSKYSEACQTYCSPDSLCRPDGRSLIFDTNNPYCICSLGYFGPRCYLKFSQCDSHPCLNNGTCIYIYESYGRDLFRCICSKFFYGDRCEHKKVSIQIQLNTSEISKFPRGSTIQFYDVDLITLELRLRHQQATRGIPSSISYDHDDIIAPPLSVLKSYSDSTEVEYFIIYIQPNRSLINISSSPSHCPHASLLRDLSLFEYHRICQNESELMCFYDNDYLCICQWDHYRVDCLMHDTEIDHCRECLSNGRCLKGDQDFVCLCPRCYQGDLCEFNLQAFGFTLDSLVVDYSREVKLIYLSIMFLLFFIGLFNNLCSFVTFKRPTPRNFGVGNYLFIITCLNQMSLLYLLIKFIQITFGIINLESCQIISYLLSVVTRLTYWLTSWVTVDRLLVLLFPTSVVLKNPRRAIGISVATSLFLFGMHIHEIIFYRIIPHLSTNSSICVTNFDTYAISIYNRVSTLIHYLLPFLIQVIGITLLIILAARSRNKTNGSKVGFRQVLIKQFLTQKELYVTPMIIILSALPQTILTFILACTQLTVWHRHILLIAYLLSYTPQLLGFILYVLPSTSYKKEFSETSFGKILINCVVKKKETILKRK